MTADELIRKMEKAGWELAREGKGSHKIYRHPDKEHHISVPYHKGKEIGKGLLNKLLKEAGLK